MSNNKLYVGNLNYRITNEQLEALFATYGEVVSVNIIEGKGFGFVEMADPAAVQKAQEELDGKDFEGRNLKVNEARPPKSRPKRNFW